MEVGSHRLVHVNAMAHPTAAWTLPQFREVFVGDHAYRFVLHDRDGVYASQVNVSVGSMGGGVIRTPVRAPPANAFCARLIGTLRRECLDYLIPLGEEHLRRLLKEWVRHFKRGCPHTSRGPDLPERPAGLPAPPLSGHRLPSQCRVVARSVLGGLHHEFGLERMAA
jgi:putative transposase